MQSLDWVDAGFDEIFRNGLCVNYSKKINVDKELGLSFGPS